MIENNRLIADFMELEPSIEVMGSSKLYYKIKGYQRHDSLIASEDEFEYHLSWDWLMPVVEKIENMKEVESAFIIEKKYSCIWVKDDECFNEEQETKLEAVYKTVVKFIKWYNKNK